MTNATIPTPSIINLTVRGAGSCRNVASPCAFAKPTFHAMLALFDGKTIECWAYGPMNIGFYATTDMILAAWRDLDKEKFWWVSEKTVMECCERFGKGEEGKLSMSLPSLFVKELPKEREALIAVADMAR